MERKTKLLILILLGSLLLTACGSKKRVKLPKYDHRESQANIWSDDNAMYGDMNMSGLDYNNSINVETETVIMEDTYRLPRVPFSQAEYSRLAKSGKGTVNGSIYIKDMYGQKVFGKDTRLYLNPVTSYSKQWYEESYLGGAKMAKADARLFNYLRFTASNSEGAFAFYGVPTGSYYLIGTVSCAEECGYDTAKSIRIATYVSVRGNEVVQKDLAIDMQ